MNIGALMKLTPEQVLEASRVALASVTTPALDIYTATGLTPAWQQAFISGRSKDPAYTRVIRLVDWLTANHADLFFSACSAVK